jgi:hypothetical protein
MTTNPSRLNIGDRVQFKQSSRLAGRTGTVDNILAAS